MSFRLGFGWHGRLAVTLLVLTNLVCVQLLTAAQVGTANSVRPVMVPANFNQLPGPQAVVPMPQEMLDPNPSAVRIRFYDPPVAYGMVQLGSDTYQSAQMLGEANTLEPGYPDVPRVTRLIMIERTGNVELTILNQQFHLEQGGIPVPVQPLQGDNDYNPSVPVMPATDVYANSDWYPAQLATISAPMTLRDVRFVVLNVFPVQVNPVTGERRVYDELEVLVENVGGTGENEISFVPTSVTPSFKKMYRMFENFEGSALDALPVFPGTMLIFCSTDATVVSNVGELALWKKLKGIDVTVRPGTWASQAIRDTISAVYAQTGGRLEYVCLVGDPDNGSGAYYMPTHWTGSEPTSQWDNYYGTLNSGGPNPDPVPDVAVGRLSNVESSSELLGIIRKTTKYESNPAMSPDSGWFKRAWCASNTGHIASNPSTKEYTRQIMLQHGVNTVYWNVYSGGGVTADLASRLGSGISVFNYRMSYIGEFGPSDITSTTVPADARNPFVMVVTCGTGSFQTGESLSERWLKPPAQTVSNPAGAIGCVGVATLSTSVPYNNVIDAGTMYALYGLDLEEQGPLLVAAKLQLYLNYWSVGRSAQVQEFSYWSNLMGDPSVPIWIKQPNSASVSKPSTIAVGTNNVAVTITDAAHGTPVSNALVCMLKGSWSSPESWTRGYTNASGQINLPVTVSTTGYLYLTATKDDLRTVRDSIQVTAAAGLSYNSRTVDDDNTGGTVGNSNGVLNPGETVDLTIGIHNNNGATISGISGTLTTTSAGINITQAVSAYANISAGANGNNTTPFRFTVSSVFNGEPVTIFLNLASSAGAFTLRLDLTPAAGDVTYVSNAFSGPGSNYDPGETGNVTVTFQNSGASLQSLISAQGILRSLDPNVIVNDSMGAYGTVTSGSNAINSGDPYNVTLSSQSYNGRVAPMMLIVHDANGFRDSTTFSITIGTRSSTSPMGPDAYGYYAFDNTETQPAGIACTYSWIEICPLAPYNGPGTSFNWDDSGEDQDDYGVLTLPFQARMYGQTFVPSQITVCDNGWLAFGSYAMWDFRNYRMGTPIGPPYMVAAYWDDLAVFSGGSTNVFYYYDVANHWYIVEWRAETQYSGVAENFQAIIYDPTYYPSVTGDCKIKLQYQTVNLSANSNSNDNDYASVGIQDGDHTVGIDYYYWNVHSAGAATLQAGRAIMFTTDATGQLNPIVVVNTPNGGETFYLGQSYNLLWSTSAISGNMNVSLNRSYPGGAWESLFANTPNDGIQAWTAAGAATTAARIRVISVNTPTAGDTSNANFTIVAPTAQVVQPNGGEFLTIGETYTILYNSTGLGAATVAINRSYPGGAWETIDPAGAGEVYWTVTGPGTSNARIRVIGNAAPAYGDTSNANFTIGFPPSMSADQHADGAPGTMTFTANVTDDVGGFVTKLFYRLVGGGNYDSVTFAATGNPDEYSAVTPALAAGYYEYYLRCTDAQNLSAFIPSSGTYTFDVAELSASAIFYDDGVAENYNWVDGTGFKWAVKFDAPAYPYALCNAKFAVCPTNPQAGHQAARVTVYSANGPGGLPGTILFSDTSGAAGNIIGGLPAGAAWADVVTRISNACLTINAAFYIAVENVEPRLKPCAFATDTTAAPRAGRSYYWDECDLQWFAETSGDLNARPGDRMIRAAGWTVTPPTITVIRSGNNAALNWTATGAPYYRIYAATTPTGAYSYVGSSSTNSFNDPTPWTTNANRFYQVTSSDAP